MASLLIAMPTRIRRYKNGHGIALSQRIIENYGVLKTYLQENGHTFILTPDTEVLAHLIGNFTTAIWKKRCKQALREVTGAYAIAVIASRSGCPGGREKVRLDGGGWKR